MTQNFKVISEVEVNRLAQRFYDASGISLPAMTDKPKVVQGLRAVFEEIGIEVENEPRVAYGSIRRIRASNCHTAQERHEFARATAVFFENGSWVCSCGAGFVAGKGLVRYSD